MNDSTYRTPMIRAEIFEGKDHQFYARFVAANGNTLFTSEGYTQKHNALGAVQAVRDHLARGFRIVDLTLKANQ